MQIYKNKAFNKWAAKEKVSEQALQNAVKEIARGLVDTYLGGNLYKKHVAIGNKGKSGGVRTLLAYRVADKAFFIYGFAKSSRSNISSHEEKVLKKYTAELMSYDDMQLSKAIKAGVLIEVKSDG